MPNRDGTGPAGVSSDWTKKNGELIVWGSLRQLPERENLNDFPFLAG